MNIEHKLRQMNAVLLQNGSDYSDVLLDAALEIERLQARLFSLEHYTSGIESQLKEIERGYRLHL